MNQWLLCAMASTFCGAGTAAAAGPNSGDGGWRGLDRDIEALIAAPRQDEPEAVQLHLLVKGMWSHFPNSSNHQDRQGFEVDNALAELDGTVNRRFSYRLELEGAAGDVAVLDAFGAWDPTDSLRVTVGNFRAPTVWESQVHEGDLLFIVRTDTGERFYRRDKGAMLSGSAGPLHWAAAVQGGLDSVAERMAISARASVDVIGETIGFHPGAHGGNRRMTALSVGAGYYDDEGQGGGDDGNVYVLDAQFRMERFAADAMVGSYNDFKDPVPGLPAPAEDSVPWNVSASYMVIEDRVEAAARYQEIDDNDHAPGGNDRRKDVTAGVNWYLSDAARLQVNASYIFSENRLQDDTVRLGVAFNVRV